MIFLIVPTSINFIVAVSLMIYENLNNNNNGNNDGSNNSTNSPLSPILCSPSSSTRTSVDGISINSILGNNNSSSNILLIDKLNLSIKHLESQVNTLQSQLNLATRNRGL